VVQPTPRVGVLSRRLRYILHSRIEIATFACSAPFDSQAHAAAKTNVLMNNGINYWCTGSFFRHTATEIGDQIYSAIECRTVRVTWE